MSEFIIETGTGVEGATAYSSVEFADSYLGADWAESDEAKEAALISGSEYADMQWGNKLASRPLTDGQGLEFPRAALKDRYGRTLDGVPSDWVKAVCLYAKESATGNLYPTTATGSAKEVKRKKTTVGPITTELEYQGVVSSGSLLTFPLADRLCKKFIYGGGTARAVRN